MRGITHENKTIYCIVPSKHPWVLTTQASKFEGGRLHGENGSTISMQGPIQDAKLAAMGLNGLASSVHPNSSRPARQWRKLYRATKRTDS